MNLTIASGKGGTGKTMLAVNLAYALADAGRSVHLLDCDVECPNAHLFVEPEFQETRAVTVKRPVWDAQKCRQCGLCSEACQFNALAVVKDQVLVFPELCHACGVCSAVCPAGAMQEAEYEVGTAARDAVGAPFVFTRGMLHIGESLAPSVIHAVRETAVGKDVVNIVDSPPGTACPAVAALEGTDVAVLVTEPTPFGVHDLTLAMELVRRMGIPAGVVINRSMEDDALVYDAVRAFGYPVIGQIPFSRQYAESCSCGEILVHRFPELREKLVAIYERAVELRDMTLPVEPSATIEDDAGDIAQSVQEINHPCQELVILSGKGGTGKTTVTAALAQLIPELMVADLDVDAADLHLLLRPDLQQKRAFSGGGKGYVRSGECLGCGECVEACRFNAIEIKDGVARVLPHLCEGCGLCKHVCPVDAVEMREHVNGHTMLSFTEWGRMAHARLGIAEENSGKLVSHVRQLAERQAALVSADLMLDDGPPGTGCPVIASLSNVDRALLVTEPSLSGLHDFKRVRKLLKHFRIPYGLIVNKADLYPEGCRKLLECARADDCFLIEELPYDPEVFQALMLAQTVVERARGPVYEKVLEIAEQIRAVLEEEKEGVKS